MHNSTIHTIGLAFLVAVIFGLGFTVIGLALQPKGRVSCADFSAYVDAVSALNDKDEPATWLDRNDDGRPCESRFPKEIKAQALNK